MFSRLFSAAAAIVLTSAFTHAASLYSGEATTTARSGKTADPFSFTVDGTTLTGAIFSNTFGGRIPVRGSVNASGRFRIAISVAGVSGYVRGRVGATRLIGSGKLRGGSVGRTTMRLKARVVLGSPNGVPDISGECEFPGEGSLGKPEYKTCYLKFSKNPDGRNYNYRAEFRHYWYRDQTATINASFPIPRSMNFSFSNSYGPQRHVFSVAFSPVSDTQVQITINSEGPSQTGVWKTKYQGYYTVQP